MDLIEDIGPILGVVAFLGFAILALLIVLQAREVRRLREWAGRAPERALEADEAAVAASEERGASERPEKTSRFAGLGAGRGTASGSRLSDLRQRLHFDPRLLIAALALGLVIAAVLTSGFGLVGDDGKPAVSTDDGASSGKPVEVAVLNATEQEGVAPPTPGIADLVAGEIVKPAGFKAGVRAAAPAGEDKSVILFEADAEADAEELAEAVEKDLGPTELREMTPEVRDQVEGAPLALLVGFDDSAIGDDALAP